ncbi:Uncharacterized protein HZ326_20969 [Fusarium oxysporum f. sp. albedinis]|nr:Uncharacterized protein HZ326_20969 [Fusarium oxysporum f. sp. albedinis]
MDNRSITIVVQSLIYIFANHKPASNKGTCITEVVSTCGVIFIARLSRTTLKYVRPTSGLFLRDHCRCRLCPDMASPQVRFLNVR